MLAVLFSLGSRRHGLDSALVERIVPALPLQALSHAPAAVAGTFSYRGGSVPVIDLAQLVSGESARPLLSTRIILVKHADPGGATRLLGLLAENVNEVHSAAGLSSDRAGAADNDAVQIISLQELLPPDLLAKLSGENEAAEKSP